MIARVAVIVVVALPLAMLWLPLGVVLLPVALLRRRPRPAAVRREGNQWIWPVQIPPDLDRTAPPVLVGDGMAACSGCDAVVPFATMAINEDGYFCPGCSRR